MVAAAGLGTALAQSAVDKLKPLVDTSARRLVLAEQVALAKWDTGAAVEDTPREEQVIAAAAQAGRPWGLDEVQVAKFFKAQIEANKIVQYSLLADWRRSGKAPAHSRIDLGEQIRPELDRIQTELIAELVETAGVRAGGTCLRDVAKAVGKYVAANPRAARPRFAIALDRALAETCP